MTEEVINYFEKTGVIAKVTDVLKLLYEMDEKPVDPLEFIRTNMTEIIPEKVELTKLEQDYNTVMQEIAILQQDIINITNRLKELETNESNYNIVEINSKENTILGLSNDDMKMHGNAEKDNEK
ncbi:c-Myc-binding protein homolog [Metopolophium dirhodum]|uniref:c-Myc-binding protein homolog n=1 Tax=Metopolophium dirhodum TaxID=44670 RepID=UPI002990488F|nr:c-Myc-binding protein homolog [Metopolophium dirhodum]